MIELSTRCALDRRQRRLGIEAVVHDDRHAGQHEPDRRQRSVVVQRADDEMRSEPGEAVRRDVLDEPGEVGRSRRSSSAAAGPPSVAPWCPR